MAVKTTPPYIKTTLIVGSLLERRIISSHMHAWHRKSQQMLASSTYGNTTLRLFFPYWYLIHFFFVSHNGSTPGD
jgi:hypothetical protein